MRRRQEANEWSVHGGKRLIYADDWNPNFLRWFFFAHERSLRPINVKADLTFPEPIRDDTAVADLLLRTWATTADEAQHGDRRDDQRSP